MTLLIGIDEAGYGPNYGPLCIGATAWEVKAESGGGKAEGVDLYQLLDNIVSPVPDKNRVAIADSKLLYKPKQGLRHLERGVLTGLLALNRPATDWQSLISPPGLPWYADYDCPLPIDAEPDEVARLASRFVAVCETANVRLVDMRARLVFPQEFNELTEQYGTKGAALSHVSIELVRKVLKLAREEMALATSATTNVGEVAKEVPEEVPEEVARSLVGRSSWPTALTTTRITCDKHGGRNRYAALLQHYFPNEPIEILEEGRAASRYRWGPPEARTEICFRTKGEAELPVALASMMAKYHRELAMRAFNAFWIGKIPNLKPTAGYPQDAKRFQSEIAAVQSNLGIEDRVLWRNR